MDLLTSERLEETKPSGIKLNLPLPEVIQSPETPYTNSKCGNYLEVQSDSPAWCSQESGYLEWEGTPSSEASTSFVSSSILSPLVEKRYEKRNRPCLKELE